MKRLKVIALILLCSIPLLIHAQQPLHNIDIDYAHPKEYQIAGIRIMGAHNLDPRLLLSVAGISEGDRIKVPGDELNRAVKNLWKQGLYSDIQIVATRTMEDKIWFDIVVKERPRLSHFSFEGVTRSQANDLRDKLHITRGETVTENLLINSRNTIRKFFVKKGYFFVDVDVRQEKDPKEANGEGLVFVVSKHRKIKVNSIDINGNEALSDKKVLRSMKEIKEKNVLHVFKVSKYNESDFQADKKNIVNAYLEQGYRDARIVSDTMFRHDDKTVDIRIQVSEGHRYYFGNITWLGNTKYSNKVLNNILNIRKGDIYDDAKLEKQLYMNPTGQDISSLYLDNGYLFFQVTPVEKNVENDSIDMEFQIYEGKQATINEVSIAGNTKTNDQVIMREIRTKPGQLFSRSDIIRSQRELAQLGYFDPEGFDVITEPHPENGTVDIKYVVEERPSDQVELSGGWGGGIVVGTLGLVFSNFSAKSLFKKGAWRPLPSGDGQRLTLRATSNGPGFQSYNMSFTEPWLGGRKPNSLNISIFHTIRSNGVKDDTYKQSLKLTGGSAGLGWRLKWPDDYFTFYVQAAYQVYNLNNYNSGGFIFTNGRSNNLSATFTLSRNDVDDPIFPTRGSKFTYSLQWTPPFSSFNDIDYVHAEPAEKYKWIEYHKHTFHASWFAPVDGKIKSKLVLVNKVGFGFLGYWNSDIGTSPFERFYMGGDGLSGFELDGRELISLRGYENNTVTPGYPNETGASIAAKYTCELRYAISKNPNATIFTLAFLEAGNSWETGRNFDPFKLKRSAGVGIRLFLPMFGLLGIDYGIPMDDIDGRPGVKDPQFHFTIGQFFNAWNSD
ncbi:MAG: outer membrane protein assembly factor BamA [Flavobacteriales bacterium]|nr:outer membrane protein assembly factor BamA [Flavobacteriales bacterium]MCB9449473.1 outer membrane protein assembly factor BamA [Flavobacteriales bacterium]